MSVRASPDAAVSSDVRRPSPSRADLSAAASPDSIVAASSPASRSSSSTLASSGSLVRVR